MKTAEEILKEVTDFDTSEKYDKYLNPLKLSSYLSTLEKRLGNLEHSWIKNDMKRLDPEEKEYYSSKRNISVREIKNIIKDGVKESLEEKEPVSIQDIANFNGKTYNKKTGKEMEPQPKEESGIDYTKDNFYDGIGRPDLKPQPKSDWICGKCEQKKKYPNAEKIAEHFRTCPNRKAEDWEEIFDKKFDIGTDNQGIIFEDETGIQRAISLFLVKQFISEELKTQREEIIKGLNKLEPEDDAMIFKKDILNFLKKQ